VRPESEIQPKIERKEANFVRFKTENFSKLFEFSLIGFNDPESGVAFHRWGVASLNASTPDVLNWIVTAEKKFLQHKAKLPTRTWLKVLVETVNNAGLSIATESMGFLIDESIPEIQVPLSVSDAVGQLTPDWLVVDDVITVEWVVSDQESGVKEYWISLWYHDTGRITFEPIKIPGLLNNFTFHNLDLKDGGNYTAQLVSCNRAGTCIRQSVSVAVDTSPPVTGHLAAATDSAVDLGRQTEDGLAWKDNQVNISWVGFQDPHSGIDRYTIQMGTTWFGSELLQETEVEHSDETVISESSDVPYVEIEADSKTMGDNGSSNAHEAPIQMASLRLQRSLTPGISFFVHLVAINKASK
uniref:Fibronectin type-III domain-containing protein n=1 Tax=Macrostomum lignano TaxID=282301 RepID=A0A1I8GJB1_9PLAT